MILQKKNVKYFAFLISFIFLLININESEADWDLEFSDEFNNNNTIDVNKWDIENEIISCYGNYENQLNCNTNRFKNMRLIDGTLAITAIYEKYLDKKFTSGKLTTKHSFTYGKFEIRAALPNGKMLRPTMFMEPSNGSIDWTRSGQIDIMTYNQNMNFESGLHYSVMEGNHYEWLKGEYSPNTNLYDFNTYSLERTQSEIKWFFNDYMYLNRSIDEKLSSLYDKNGESFDKAFKLVINLGVGGSEFFPNMTLKRKDVINWKCSLLILDYVRIYKWVNESINNTLTSDDISVEQICQSVMPLITPKRKFKVHYIVISVIGSIIIFVLFPIFIYLLIRQKRLNRKPNDNYVEGYDDILSNPDYDLINCGNDYSETYQDLNVLEDCYVLKDDDFKRSDICKHDKKLSDPQYLVMDKRTNKE